MKAPCANCERKGCGSYHDECEKYQDYLKKFKAIKSYNADKTAKRKTYLLTDEQFRGRKPRRGPFKSHKK